MPVDAFGRNFPMRQLTTVSKTRVFGKYLYFFHFEIGGVFLILGQNYFPYFLVDASCEAQRLFKSHSK